jgi:hypothetical protein
VELILIIVVLVLLFGGGGGYWVAVEVIGDRMLRSERRVLYRLWWQLEHADIDYFDLYARRRNPARAASRRIISIVGIMPPGKIMPSGKI